MGALATGFQDQGLVLSWSGEGAFLASGATGGGATGFDFFTSRFILFMRFISLMVRSVSWTWASMLGLLAGALYLLD